MSLKSIGNVLNSVGNQYKRQDHQQFQQVVEHWSEAVGAVVAAQSCPLSIYRGVLKVAASSAPWAQTLTFERQRILEKLNLRLATALTDIRFSTAEWQTQKSVMQSPGSAQQATLWQNHPSRLSNLTQIPQKFSIQEQTDPNAAFRHWATVMQARSRHLPLCPGCSCPTPAGELERWSVCSLCAPKGWSDRFPDRTRARD